MYQRLDKISEWLDAYGLMHNANYDRMLRRMAGLHSEDISALRTLADAVEPVKGYARARLAISEPTAATPLNRVIDAARPESATARRFSVLVDAFVSGQIRPGMELQIRAMLTEWRNNPEKLRPLTEKSPLVQEVAPISHNLGAMGAAGLQALEYLDHGEKAPEDWKTQQLALAEEAIQPKAQLLLMIAPPVKKLIQASAGDKPTDLPIPQSAVE